jgi:hypothetical protein
VSPITSDKIHVYYRACLFIIISETRGRKLDCLHSCETRTASSTPLYVGGPEKRIQLRFVCADRSPI